MASSKSARLRRRRVKRRRRILEENRAKAVDRAQAQAGAGDASS